MEWTRANKLKFKPEKMEVLLVVTKTDLRTEVLFPVLDGIALPLK